MDGAPVASSSSAAVPMPPELEQTLTVLSSHRSVLGYMLLTRSHPITIIRHSGVVFEGEQGRKYASAVGRIVDSVHRGLEEVSSDQSEPDDMRFMRIRTKRHEIMISPGTSRAPTGPDSRERRVSWFALQTSGTFSQCSTTLHHEGYYLLVRCDNVQFVWSTSSVLCTFWLDTLPSFVRCAVA
ncbi:uncharacterized protein B0H18DRAFT_987955 [Fomitopsis serialis]|uniref:uncharacterized protein n=1 Tax=Fomitopsis serialis TaxID=139415 RepID=UPI002008C224|nr:uncharacterized protein B0H18DRAFT_987955 [Neoantrodia serialis]KAH9932393.1 hypothetical protein B0H18DRAFT_987955 [Neoantrodia serialis]